MIDWYARGSLTTGAQLKAIEQYAKPLAETAWQDFDRRLTKATKRRRKSRVI